MISITRLPEPTILDRKKEKWLAAYLRKRETNPQSRPFSSQYGHQEIRETLAAMSFHKCFYCERKLVETKGQVDHYIEVKEAPKLAFDWNNLYLSCPECNSKKISHRKAPVSECLDPCKPAENPADHLTFEGEYISPRPASQKGAKTIQKYKLDRGNLNHLRGRQLRKFMETLLKLRDRQIRDGGRSLTDSEKELLASFKEPHHAFSLMFRSYLAKLEL